MSVSSTANQVIYIGSGTTGPFDFTFRIYESTDLLVQKVLISTEAVTTLTETTDYTVTIDVGGTGHIDTVAAVTSSYKLVITRTLPITQDISYVDNDKFPAATHEEGLDRGIMIDQQLQEQIDRCVKVTTGSATAPDDLVDSLVAASATAVQAATDAETAQTAAELAQAAAEAAAGSMTLASQAEAEAGTENTKYLSSLRTAQAITAQAPLGTWVDYAATSTITGFQTVSTKVINVLKIGKIVFVDFFIEGTSNATGFKFTLPYANASGQTTAASLGVTVDSGSNVSPNGGISLAAAASEVIVYKTVGTAASWTNSGTKYALGQFFYKTT